MTATAPYSLAAVVSNKALAALLEASGQGTYRDEHPWLVAADLVAAAAGRGERVPILFAAGQPATFSHWGFVIDMEVLELHRSSWLTACRFTRLTPVNPIFEAIDSVFLKPADEQLERERREDVPRHRHPLTEAELRPYAICETPPFVLREG